MLDRQLQQSIPYAIRKYDEASLRDALLKMHLIRMFEEEAENSYMRGLIHGTMHLSIGQEASAIGSTMSLTDEDMITSTHRGHGHCIAKNADPGKMFAEFFGKETGYCKGRGGSMHIADPSKGNLGANGIVGGGLPIAVGAALSAKRLKTGAVTVCFFGDGANNEGSFHESLNMASIWKLPVVFVCENNKYGMSTSMEKSTAVGRISDRAAGYSMPGSTVDGNDFSSVAEAVDSAVSRARDGDGPSLIENITYRWRGHSKSDRNRYRNKEEITEWMSRDPIKIMEAMLVENSVIDEQSVESVRSEAERRIKDALEFAVNSPSPSVAEASKYVYSDEEAA